MLEDQNDVSFDMIGTHIFHQISPIFQVNFQSSNLGMCERVQIFNIEP